jgi:hypothetical protein
MGGERVRPFAHEELLPDGRILPRDPLRLLLLHEYLSGLLNEEADAAGERWGVCATRQDPARGCCGVYWLDWEVHQSQAKDL